MFRLFSPKCSLCLLYEVLLKTSIYSGFTSIYNRFVPYFPMFFPHVSHRFVRKKIQRFDVKAPSIVVHFISFPYFPMVFPHFPHFPMVFPHFPDFPQFPMAFLHLFPRTFPWFSLKRPRHSPRWPPSAARGAAPGAPRPRATAKAARPRPLEMSGENLKNMTVAIFFIHIYMGKCQKWQPVTTNQYSGYIFHYVMFGNM